MTASRDESTAKKGVQRKRGVAHVLKPERQLEAVPVEIRRFVPGGKKGNSFTDLCTKLSENGKKHNERIGHRSITSPHKKRHEKSTMVWQNSTKKDQRLVPRNLTSKMGAPRERGAVKSVGIFDPLRKAPFITKKNGRDGLTSKRRMGESSLNPLQKNPA